MKINANTIESYLKNVPKSIQFFLVYGHEPSQIHLIKQKLLNAFTQDQTEEDLNISNFSFSKIKESASLLADEMSSNSLFGGRTILVIEDSPAALGKDFIKVLKEPRGDAIVIFLADELKPTSSLRKNCETLPNCVAIACYKDDKSSLQRYINETFRSKNMPCSPDVPGILADALPANRMLVNSEIEKLLIYKLGDNTPINIDDIKAVSMGTGELSLDDLCMAIALKNGPLTQKSIAGLIADDKNFIFVIRVLLKYFVRIFEAKVAMEQGLSAMQAVSKLMPPVFFKQKDNLVMVCGRVSTARAVALIKRLVQLELECKNSSISPELLTFNTLTHISRAA